MNRVLQFFPWFATRKKKRGKPRGVGQQNCIILKSNYGLNISWGLGFIKWLIETLLVIMPTNTLWSHALMRACLSHFKLADNMRQVGCRMHLRAKCQRKSSLQGAICNCLNRSGFLLHPHLTKGKWAPTGSAEVGISSPSSRHIIPGRYSTQRACTAHHQRPSTSYHCEPG